MVSGRHLLIVIMGTDVTMIFTNEIITQFESFVYELDEIWHDAFYA